MLYAPRLNPAFQPGLTRRDALRFFGIAGTAAMLAPLVGRSADPTSAAAAITPGAQPGFYRFKIGAFDATAFVDGALVGPTTQLQLWKGHPPEEISSEFKNAFLNPDEVRISFSVLLVRMGSELVLVDSGCGPLFGPMGGRLLHHLATAGVKPEQITAVILTHAHGDHMGGMLSADGKVPVFKNARHFIHRREFEFWTETPDLSGQALPDKDKIDMINGAKTYLAALKFDKIKAGEKLLDGLEIIDAPGHTPGHIALLFSSGDQQLLHLVDCVHHHVLSFAHPDWNFAFDADPSLAIKTRKKILDRAAADRLRIFGAHLPFPTLGHVRVAGKDRYEHVVEPWIS
jgi:glyoxylase-like metal-dependent hydrolase (beta-lactamase superfamily II)